MRLIEFKKAGYPKNMVEEITKKVIDSRRHLSIKEKTQAKDGVKNKHFEENEAKERSSFKIYFRS